MTQQIPYSTSKLDKVMTQDQFTQVIEAILEGKYSWACVLILRFGGYNPLHYIPYRTYNRITKENCQTGNQGNQQINTINPNKRCFEPERDTTSIQESPNRITDLNYLEVIHKQPTHLRGGTHFRHLKALLYKQIPNNQSYDQELASSDIPGFSHHRWYHSKEHR